MKLTSKFGLNKSAGIFLLFLFQSVYLIFPACNSAQNTKSKDIDIHQAVIKNEINKVKQYIASKKNINVKDAIGGSSPLITASLFGRIEIASLLINAGADINQINNDGSTALHTSALFCHTEIVKLLLNKGADKSIKNKYKNTALDLVLGSFSSMKGVFEMLEQMLSPLGLKLDYTRLEKTRPIIVKILQ